jgi:NAD-dependent DNA ligase
MKIVRCDMKLATDPAITRNACDQPGSAAVEVSAVCKTSESFDCYLSVTQAMRLAQHLLMKAELIQEEGRADSVVHLSNPGPENERLYCRLHDAREGFQREEPFVALSQKIEARPIQAMRKDAAIAGKIIVFTGSLERMTHDQARVMAQRFGAKVAGSISKMTDYVVAGPGAEANIRKAKGAGIGVLTEEQWLDLVGEPH